MIRVSKQKVFRIYYWFQQIMLILYLLIIIPIAVLLLISYFLLFDVRDHLVKETILLYLIVVSIIFATFGIPLLVSILSRRAAKNISEDKKPTIIQIVSSILYPFTSCFVWFVLYMLFNGDLQVMSKPYSLAFFACEDNI